MGGSFSSTSSKSATTKRPAGGGVSSVDRAVLDLKNARDRLSRYKRKLQQDEAKLVARAKQAKEAGQTKTALNLLRLRKYKLNEVDSVETQLLNVLQMVQTIDSKQNETQVLEALRVGKDTLQKMHEKTTVDDVLELMDQIQEQNQVEKEISDILQEGVPELSIEDEAAVESELEQLMLSQQGQPTATTATTTTLPEAPTAELLPTAPTNKLPEVAIAEERVAVPS